MTRYAVRARQLLRPSLWTRIKYALIRLRLGRDGRRLADEIARKQEHEFFFGPDT